MAQLTQMLIPLALTLLSKFGHTILISPQAPLMGRESGN
jgi:hypothetical protein